MRRGVDGDRGQQALRVEARQEVAALLAVGLTLEEAWDVAEVASMYNFTNRMAMATNMLPNEEYAGVERP